LFSGSPLSFGSEKEKAYSCDSVGGMGYTSLGIKRRCMQIRAVVWVVNVCGGEDSLKLNERCGEALKNMTSTK